jgi:chromosome segregation ATPase
MHRLQAEIDTLRETNTRVVAERDAAVEERNDLIDRLSTTEDDLAAVRRSLRQMIRNQNEPETQTDSVKP